MHSLRKKLDEEDQKKLIQGLYTVVGYLTDHLDSDADGYDYVYYKDGKKILCRFDDFDVDIDVVSINHRGERKLEKYCKNRVVEWAYLPNWL